MTVDDLLELLVLSQTQINQISNPVGLVVNGDTGNLNLNGQDIVVNASPESLPIIVLTSTNDLTSITTANPVILEWDSETEKDNAFSHDNNNNPSKITIDEDGTYEIEANVRVFSPSQRGQFVLKIIKNGSVLNQPYGSSYIRNNGNSSDYWTCTLNAPPMRLNQNDEIEIQIEIESQLTSPSVQGTFIGSQSSFSIVKLQGSKGEKGDAGSGSTIAIQKNGVVVGSVFDVLNMITSLPVTDAGGGKVNITLGDCLRSVYDPNNVNGDAFDYANQLGVTQLKGDILSFTMTQNYNNFNPTGFSTANLLRLNPTNNIREISGFEKPPVGINRKFTVQNTNQNNMIKFRNNSSLSTAGNRLLIPDSGDRDLRKQDSVTWFYDHTSNRWRVWGGGLN